MNDNAGWVAEFAAWWKSDPTALGVAGAAGAAARALVAKERILQAIRSMVVGVLCAEYLTDTAMHYLPTGTTKASAGFVVGVCGIMAVGFFIDFFQHLTKKAKGNGP